MIRATIDIGTNTALLLVAEVERGQITKVYDEQQRIPRLGKGVDTSKRLSQESMDRAVDSILDFKNLLLEKYPQASLPIVTATSAVRYAQNKDDFLQQVLDKTGYKVNVLSGNQEAELTYKGALAALDRNSIEDHRKIMIVDIGGGSTEIAVGIADVLQDSFSYDMGCVRFTERFFVNDPPSNSELIDAQNEAVSLLRSHVFESSQMVMVGVAGTVTSLAWMLYEVGDQYTSQKVNAKWITHKQLTWMFNRLTRMTTDQIQDRWPIVMKGRADIFLSGLVLLKTIMETYRVETLIVSTGGIRHGVMITESFYDVIGNER